MTFAEDLRKPYVEKDTIDYQYCEGRVSECIQAIKDACKEAQKTGKQYIKGGFYIDDTDYGTYKITEKGTFLRWGKAGTVPYIKQRVEKDITVLGFNKYKVTVIERDEMMPSYRSVFGNQKYKKSGYKQYAFYIEIEW